MNENLSESLIVYIKYFILIDIIMQMAFYKVWDPVLSPCETP